MNMQYKMDADDRYTPEQLERFRKVNRDLDEYNAALDAWKDSGKVGPEPRDPGYTPEEVGDARYWLSERTSEVWRKYRDEKRLRAERGEPEPEDISLENR